MEIPLHAERFRDVRIDAERADDLPFVIVDIHTGGTERFPGFRRRDVVVAVAVLDRAAQHLKPEVCAAVSDLSAGDFAVGDGDDCGLIPVRQIVKHDLGVLAELVFQRPHQLREKFLFVL